MNLKAMVSLAGLAVAAAGCGSLVADSPVTAVAIRYASDGTLVVFTGSAIDSYGPDLAQKVHISVPWVQAPLFSVSDDGSVVALSSNASGHQVAMYDLFTGQGTGAIGLDGIDPPDGVTLSPTGDLLYVSGGVDGDCCTNGMFDTSTGNLLWSGSGRGISAPFFSNDESTLYVVGGAGLRGMDSRTGAVGLNASSVDSLQGFGGMADPNTLIGVAVFVVDPATDEDSTEINLISTADGSLTGQVLLPVNTTLTGNGFQQPFFHCAPDAGLCALYVLEYDPDHTTVIANSVQVWALDGTLVQSIDKMSGDVAISPDGLAVALMNDGEVTISPDGQYVAAIYDGDVTVYRVSDGSRVKFLP